MLYDKFNQELLYLGDFCGIDFEKIIFVPFNLIIRCSYNIITKAIKKGRFVNKRPLDYFRF